MPSNVPPAFTAALEGILFANIAMTLAETPDTIMKARLTQRIIAQAKRSHRYPHPMDGLYIIALQERDFLVSHPMCISGIEIMQLWVDTQRNID